MLTKEAGAAATGAASLPSNVNQIALWQQVHVCVAVPAGRFYMCGNHRKTCTAVCARLEERDGGWNVERSEIERQNTGLVF